MHVKRLLTLAAAAALAATSALTWNTPAVAKKLDAPTEVIVKPATPSIASLQLDPATLTLHDGRDARQVLVYGITADGQRFDLTSDAKFAAQSDAAARVAEGNYVEPVGTGDAT